MTSPERDLDEPLTPRHPRWWVAVHRWLEPLVLAVILMMLGLSWAVSSAPASAADDDFHLASIWCAWGREATGCVEVSSANGIKQVTVDSLSRYSSECWLRQANESAQCIYLRDDGTYGEVPARPWPSRANDGSYPSTFYSLMRLFVIPHSVASIVFVRLASFALCMLLLTLPALLVDAADRRRVFWYWLAAATPLGLWVFASSNPSGVAICAAASTFMCAFAIARSTAVRKAWAAGVLGALATLLGDGARADAMWFCGIALVCGLLAGDLRARPHRGWLPVLPILFSLAFALASGRRGGMAEDVLPIDVPVTLFGNLSNLATLYVGEWSTRLGWLDTQMPSVVWGGMALCFGALAILGLTRFTRGRAIALALAMLACFVVPVYVLTSTNQPVGSFVQPRYLLPLTMVLAGALAVRARGVPAGIGRPQAFAIAALALTANSLALHTNLRRSLTGMDVPDWNLNRSIEWWWDVPVSPMLVWILGSVSYATLTVWLAWRVTTEDLRETPSDEQPAPARSELALPLSG